jgi:hypothetical protein
MSVIAHYNYCSWLVKQLKCDKDKGNQLQHAKHQSQQYVEWTWQKMPTYHTGVIHTKLNYHLIVAECTKTCRDASEVAPPIPCSPKHIPRPL